MSETSVQQYGQSGADYQILIELPGIDDPAHAKELIGTTAVLQITGVDKQHDTPFIQPRRRLGETRRYPAAE